MKLTFLGTSAANAYPIAFCRCDNCAQARRLGGTSLRSRCAALINDDLLIDLAPDIMTASFRHACPLTNVRYCLQTHSHADHLDPAHLFSRSPEYGVIGAPRLHFYGSAASLRLMAELATVFLDPSNLLDPKVGERLNLEIHPVEPRQSFSVGPCQVTAFPANHDPAVEPLLYAVQAENCAIFYGTDTTTLPEDTWQAFHKFNLCFDIVVLDHTYGPGLPDSDHLSARGFIEHVARMREEGLLTGDARAFATHISHEGNPPHPELSAFAAQYGYEIAYDGLIVYNCKARPNN